MKEILNSYFISNLIEIMNSTVQLCRLKEIFGIFLVNSANSRGVKAGVMPYPIAIYMMHLNKAIPDVDILYLHRVIF